MAKESTCPDNNSLISSHIQGYGLNSRLQLYLIGILQCTQIREHKWTNPSILFTSVSTVGALGDNIFHNEYIFRTIYCG